MTALIIGDDNVTFNLVIKTMKESSIFENCNENWRKLALELNTAKAKVTKIATKTKDDAYGTSDILLDLLEEWRARVSINAKLEIFTEALTKSGLDDISKILTNKFCRANDNNSGPVNQASDKIDDDETPITEEGKKLKEYVQYYIVDLIEITDLSDDQLGAMTEKDVLEKEDIDNINRSRFLEDKVKRLYQIILKKVGKMPEVYETIITVFMEDESNRERGVADILNRYFD